VRRREPLRELLRASGTLTACGDWFSSFKRGAVRVRRVLNGLKNIERKRKVSNKIFEGITILDFTSNLAGPGCASLFADLGANVIKIERPVTGDDTRAISPLMDGLSLQYMWLNRGKKSIVLSLKDPEAQAIVCKMAETADVVIESYKPGQMMQFGLDSVGIRKYNEKIIYCSVSAYGQEGAYAKLPGFDVMAQAMSGLIDLAGESDGGPTKMGTPVGDFVGTANAFGAICAALYHRLRTGHGQYIDISLTGGLLSCNTSLDISATFDTHPTRIGQHDLTVVPYGLFKGRNNEYVAIVGCTYNLWPKMCKLMDRMEWTELPEYSNATARMAHQKEVVAAVEEFLRQFEKMDDAVAAMKAEGIPCNKVMNTYDVAHDPVLWETGYVTEIPTPKSIGKTFKGRGPWIKFSKTPLEFKASPDLGADNYDVLEHYGWSKEKIDELEAKWASQ